MRIHFKLKVLLFGFILSVGLLPADAFVMPVSAEEHEYYRIAGETRYETCLEIADKLKDAMQVDFFESAVVACGNNFPDGLSGSYLAYVKKGPLLITSDKYQFQIQQYICENVISGGTIYILGSVNAISPSFEQELSGYNCVRLAGADRYLTNLAVLWEINQLSGDLIVCTGENFADGLSASAIKLPILLVKSELSTEQLNFLKSSHFTHFYIMGNASAVNATIEKTLTEFAAVTRIGGTDRYETSVKIGEYFSSNAQSSIFTYAYNFPDGLCAGPLAIQLGMPIILTTDNNCASALNYVNLHLIKKGLVIGGETLISNQTMEKVLDFDIVVLPDFMSLYSDSGNDSNTVYQIIESYLKENYFQNYLIELGDYGSTNGTVAFQNCCGKMGNRALIIIRIQD